MPSYLGSEGVPPSFAKRGDKGTYTPKKGLRALLGILDGVKGFRV